MRVKLEVPFFSNTPDDFHCFQAALRMVLAYHFPTKTYDWKKLDRLTAHTANYTWPSAGLLYCASIGLEVRLMDGYDYKRFAIEGYDYLVEIAGKEVADDQQRNSDLAQEMEYAKKLLSIIPAEKKIPSLENLRECLLQGRLVICNVNSRTLNVQGGYAGHFVVVIGLNDEGVWLHDPGLPAIENRLVTWDEFDRAWSYPDSRARNIMTFRLPDSSSTV
jgi:hypothetical protein